MRALVTNDDGIESPGIATLARAALEAGYEVLVAAPSWDSSGAGASLTSVEEDGRFLVRTQPLAGLDATCVSVEASPAFIVRAAMHEAFGPRPDLVLSGINLGYNTGHAVLHSGTVGAASTATTYDVPGVAFSIGTSPAPRWSTAAAVVAAVLGWVRGRPGSHLLNVNVPNLGLDELAGLRTANLATFGAVIGNVTERGKDYVAMEYGPPHQELEPGTDVALLGEGFATVTALEPICEARDIALDTLEGLPIPDARGPLR